MKERRVKVILVDLDGTLADTMAGLYRVYLKFLSLHGKKGSKEEFNNLVGPSIKEIVLRLKQTYEFPYTPEQLFEEYLGLLRSFYRKDAKPVAGSVKVLQELHKRGFKLILVTSAVRELAESFLQGNNLNELFSAAVCGDEVSRGKPAPDLYIEAVRVAQVNPNEAIAIEDSPAGLQSALEAGVFTYIFSNQKRKGSQWQAIVSWDEIPLKQEF